MYTHTHIHLLFPSYLPKKAENSDIQYDEYNSCPDLGSKYHFIHQKASISWNTGIPELGQGCWEMNLEHRTSRCSKNGGDMLKHTEAWRGSH